jgi:putative MATE family efflux protein
VAIVEEAPIVESAVTDVEHSRMTRTVLRLSIPVVVERMSVSTLAAVDALLVGHYVGSDGVAAVGMGALMFWIPLAGAFGLDIATTAVIARDYGGGKADTMERTMRAALLAALVWGLAAAVFLFALAGPLLTMMGAKPDVRSEGMAFMQAAAFGFPGLMLLYAVSGIFRGLGNTVISMTIIIVLNIVNAAVAFLLISGTIGIELGTRASGIGYAAGGMTGGVLALVVLLSGFGPVRCHLEHAFVTGRQEIRRLANVGLPSGLEEVQFMAAFILYSRIVYGLGTTAVAAHTVALRTLDVALMPGFALGAAGTTLVSRYLGAKRPDIAERAARTSLAIAVGTMLVMGLALFAFAPQFVSLFVDDEDVVSTGTRLLRIFAIAFPFMGLHASLGGALRGAGDNRYVLGVLTVTAWCIRIPVALVCAFLFGWGAPGAWIGATSENIVRGNLILRRFRQDKWKDKVV